MVDKAYYTWKDFRKRYQLAELPAGIMEDGFFVDGEQWKVCLSRKLAVCLAGKGQAAADEMSVEDFAAYMLPQSRLMFLKELDRLWEEKFFRVESHYQLQAGDEPVTALFVMMKIPGKPYLAAFVHLNYELMHEYKQQLEEVTEKLWWAESLNQLILEGATDYIYQLDLLNNTCTFSPQALEVLPLESASFPNAMDRVLSFIVPEDRNIFLESFTPFLTGKSLYHNAEYRVKNKQGEIMWISCHGKGVLDDEGRPMMIAGSLIDITEKKKTAERIHRMFYYDTLTGLKNSYCYEEEVREFMSKEGASGSIVCVDIRNFKTFNEIFGHSFGDRILKEFAGLLPMYVPDCLGIYRVEGDEFLIHLDESDEEEILRRLAPLQMVLGKARVMEGHNIYIDVNLGIAVYPRHGRTPEELRKNADTILYQQSRDNRDQLFFFREDKSHDLTKRYALENELRKDIDENFRHFRVVYQPIVKLGADGSYWHSAEALLRYANPAMPDVRQMELIETLEMTNLIIPVGRWVIRQAVIECSQWLKSGAHATVHVNCSAQQLTDAGLYQYICDTLKRYDLPPGYLTLELTETSLINSFESAVRMCRKLMKMGVKIALDDFGTGYSSFNYLKNLPINQIKIDKDYSEDLEDNEYNQIIVSCLHDLSRNMGLELCVEGVETGETLGLLYNMGVSLVQGFYFERPLEADVIRKEFSHHIPR